MRAFFNEMIAIVTGKAPRDPQPLPAVVTGSLFYDPQTGHHQRMQAVAVDGAEGEYTLCQYDYKANQGFHSTGAEQIGGSHDLVSVVDAMASHHRDMMACGYLVEGNPLARSLSLPNLETVAREHGIPCNLLVNPTSVPVQPARLEQTARFN